jgi:hypothetical protein
MNNLAQNLPGFPLDSKLRILTYSDIFSIDFSSSSFKSECFISIKFILGIDLCCFNARSNSVHITNARVCFDFSTDDFDFFKHRNGLRYYRAQQVELLQSDYLWKRSPEDFCQGI